MIPRKKRKTNSGNSITEGESLTEDIIWHVYKTFSLLALMFHF